MTEADDVRAVLAQTGLEGEPLGMVNQRDVPGLFVGIVPHQDGELPAWHQRTGTVADQQPIAFKERLQGRRPRQASRVIRV